ncbi:hypothetical protein AHiyo8_31720 [Arthrobacter sp. Hiyo8]|nr:hypothetical protein AHiyo8_31720 [Arthrobacter sp. Hiyo8]
MEAFLAELPDILSGDVRNIAITSVGSTASKDHETRIADAILSSDSEMRISISSDFYSSVFRDRDYTAILNSALMETGEDLVAMLEASGRRHFPSATMWFAKNDGGRAPLARLAVIPIHGLRPEPAMQILGAATLAGARMGRSSSVRTLGSPWAKSAGVSLLREASSAKGTRRASPATPPSSNRTRPTIRSALRSLGGCGPPKRAGHPAPVRAGSHAGS